MRELKLQLNIYSPRDYLRIQDHLSKMAEKGWMLEQADRFFWRYRICVPKKLRFSVLFFQDLDWEEPYFDRCREAGWQFVCGFSGMQIFCTEDPDLPPIEVAPTPRWKAIQKSAMSRDRMIWFGIAIVALYVLGKSIFMLFRDPVEVLADGPRLMYGLLMIAGLIFALCDAVHYFHWRHKARREFNKFGTLTEPKGNLIGFGIGLAVLLVMLVVALILDDPYGRIVTLMNIGSVVVALLAATAYRLIKKRKSADAKVNNVVTIAIALIVFLLLGMVEGAVLDNRKTTYDSEDMILTVQKLTGQAEEGDCLIEVQDSPFMTDLSGENTIVSGEERTILRYRLTICKNEKLLNMVHENTLPYDLHDSQKIESQSMLKWKSEGTWLMKSGDDRYTYTYYIYYGDRAATLLVSWELTEEQIDIVSDAFKNAANGKNQ